MFKPGVVLGRTPETPAKVKAGPIPASEVPQRSMSLTQASQMLIRIPGVTAEPFGSFAIEAENTDREPYFVYHLPDGDNVFEARIPGSFVLGLVRTDGTSALSCPLPQASTAN